MRDVSSEHRTHLPPPQGILFDLGDTILAQPRFDSEAGSKRLLELAQNPRGVSVGEIEFMAREINREIRRRREAAMVEFPVECFQRLLYDRLGITFDASPKVIAAEFWNAANEMIPEPGVEAVLQWLRDEGIAAGVVSNSVFGESVLSGELERHGLREYFRFVMSSADYGFRKPHPTIFLTAVGKLGLEAKDVWFVGDSLSHDIAGALAAELIAVWYNRRGLPQEDPPPHIEIHTWGKFSDLVSDGLPE